MASPNLLSRVSRPPQEVPERFYQRWCGYGRSSTHLIASVALRAPSWIEKSGLVVSRAVVLDEVWTHRKHRDQGHATGLLKLAQMHALRRSWAVYCRPVAHDGGPGPNSEELFRFYREREFEMLPLNPQWLCCYPF